MNSLVIGNTSQLGRYFPDTFHKISSRDIDFSLYENLFFDRIYVTFAEQRTFIENSDEIFSDVNYFYTIKVIEFFSKICNKLIYYSTTELWNNENGEISIDTPFNYNISSYISSKYLMTEFILSKRKYNEWANVVILYPFNFNSIYRKDGFLFSKIFDSIINNKEIEIGDTYFYRELIHPKYVVEKSLKCVDDQIVGSGRLVHINDFIRSLYKYFDVDYNKYVKENKNNNINLKRNIFYLNSKDEQYFELFNDTINEIKREKNIISK